jgi:hypothetical protein
MRHRPLMPITDVHIPGLFCSPEFVCIPNGVVSHLPAILQLNPREMAPRDPTKPKSKLPLDSTTSGKRSMKDPGPSHPLPLKPSTKGTKRKYIETQTPTTPVPKVRTPDSPMSTASIDSRRSTASRRGEEVIHEFPVRKTEKCEVYVFGAGSMGELGLGATGRDRDVKRPRLNAHLGSMGVVDVAVGGMHVAAVDYTGRLWSWGVNDQGSLGRDTKIDNAVSMKDDEDNDDEEELNPLESKPGLVQGFPEGLEVVKLACGDSISVAIANDGRVYSWGTFRVSPLKDY